jgi:putative hydrolase of the HAD superfamily
VEFALPTPTASRTDPPEIDPWLPPTVRVVCLDIDDTLVDFTAAGRHALAEMIGRRDMWPAWEDVTEAHVAMVVAGDLDYASMHRSRTRAFLAELGACVDDDLAARFERRRAATMRCGWELFSDVIPCLDWLRAAGVRLAAVTNASGAHQRAKLDDLGLSRFFDHVAIAGEVGASIPGPWVVH